MSLGRLAPLPPAPSGLTAKPASSAIRLCPHTHSQGSWGRLGPFLAFRPVPTTAARAMLSNPNQTTGEAKPAHAPSLLRGRSYPAPRHSL